MTATFVGVVILIVCVVAVIRIGSLPARSTKADFWWSLFLAAAATGAYALAWKFIL